PMTNPTNRPHTFHLACDFARATSLLAIVLLTTTNLLAGESLWKKVIPAKTVSFSKPASKGAKAPTELPPKEAAKACLATAEELQQQGCDREAALLFERARQLDPKQTRICRNLAMLYDRQGDFAKALVEYEKAL